MNSSASTLNYSSSLEIENSLKLSTRDFFSSIYYNVIQNIINFLLNNSSIHINCEYLCGVVNGKNKFELTINNKHVLLYKDDINYSKFFQQIYNTFLDITSDEEICGGKFLELIKLELKISKNVIGGDHNDINDPAAAIEIVECEKAFDERIKTFILKNHAYLDVEQFLIAARDLFEEKLLAIQNISPVLKIGACLTLLYNKSEVPDLEYHIQCENKILDIETNFSEFYRDNFARKCLKQMEDFEKNGSGWGFKSIKEITICVNHYNALRGGGYIQLPKFLERKRAIINVRNNDNNCFKWAVLSGLHRKKKNAERTSQYLGYLNELNFNGINFPTPITQMTLFEKLNPSISIHVYMYDEYKKKVYPIRLSEEIKQYHLHLMLITEADKRNEGDLSNVLVKSHYCFISNLSRLVSHQISANEHKLFLCDRCLQYFYREEFYKDHIDICIIHNSSRISMPKENDNIIKFKNYERKLPVPFIIYADTESILKSTTAKFTNTTTTSAYQEHECYSIGYYLKSYYDNIQSYYKAKRGPDCIQWFVNELKLIASTIEDTLNNKKPLTMSNDDIDLFEKSDMCHICEEKFNVNDVRVRDHSHITGRFRGAAHGHCNLKFQESKTIPIVFHNLSGYDSHFFIKEIANGFEGEVIIIPINDQN